MATNTPRYQLKKPAGTDPFLTADFQTNYDKIDAAIPKGTLGYAASVSSGDITANNVNFALLARVDVIVPSGARKVMIVCAANAADATDGLVVHSLRRDGVEIVLFNTNAKTGANTNNGLANGSSPCRVHIDAPTAGAHRYEWYFRASVAVAGADATVRQTTGGSADAVKRAFIWVGEQ
jgi:hypothetical protein